MKKILLFLSFCIFSLSVFAQTRTITGTVLSADKNEPLVGVTIQVKGNSAATQTDVNGKYSIKVTNMQNVVMTAKYVGFNYQERTLRIGENNWDVKLEPSKETSLEDVVVVGYGTQKKIHLTGAIAQVDMKKVEDIPSTNLAATLRGQLPNVSITGGVDRPGNNASITIRNPIFFAKDGKTDPLYIIDDIQRTLNDFNLLDPSEVESVSVLKDASAAIYGILGANGVVVVKTKRGKAGTPKINYSGSYGVTDATKLPDMMNGYDQARYLNDVLQSANGYNVQPNGDITNPTTGVTTRLSAYYSPDELAHFKENNYDHLRDAWQSSYIMRHAVNVSGGSDRATYFAGATYTKQNSNFSGVSTDKLTFRASADVKVANGLKVSTSVSGALGNNKRYYFKQGSESLNNDFISLQAVPQFRPMYFNGLPVLQNSNTGTTEGANFFEVQRLDNYTLQRSNVLNVLASLDYDVPFVKGLKATLSYNRNINNDFSKQYGTSYKMYTFSGLGQNRHIVGGDLVVVNGNGGATNARNGDIVRFTPGYLDVYQFNGILSYARKFGKHDISAIALFEQQENHGEKLNAAREAVLVGGFDNMNFATGAQTTDQANGAISNYGRLAYAGRINYNYDNKYLVEVSLRTDANNNFAPGKQYGFFPSASLGWVLSEESFFKRGVKFVDYLKFRGSVGLLGNDSSKPYLYQENYKLETGKAAVFGGNNDRGNTFAPNVAIANANTSWDKNLTTNFGIDAQFLNNRLSVTVDGFYAHRYDLLAQVQSSAPATIGAALPSENYAAVNTFGYELSLGWRDKIGKDFTYNFSPFLAWSDNKLLITDQPLGNYNTYLDNRNRSSDPGFLGLHTLGMFRSQAEADAYVAANPGYTIYNQKPMAGMLYYQDVRGPRDASGQFTGPDGKITDDDMDYLNNKESNHYSLGLNFGGGYKGFSLNVTMGMSFGGVATIEGDARKLATATINRPEFWNDHWTPENPNAKYPAPYYSSTYDKASDFWTVSSFTFRVANINLGYTFPASITKRMNIGSLRAFAVATNPVNFYNPYSYRDNSNAYNTYPNLRSLSFGLNVGF